MMDKAGKVLRRGSVRIKSLGTGHGELGMVLCGLQDMRLAAKNFAQAQRTASEDLLKWSLKAENRAIQDTLIQLLELSTLWEDVQKDFTEHLREFRNNFQLIYEGERSVDHARTQLAAHEAAETSLRKEIKKAGKKRSSIGSTSSPSEEVQQLEVKFAQTQRSKELAQMEVVDKVQENEAVKLLRVKESLTKLSHAYLELAAKCSIIFESHQEVVSQMPDVQDKNIHDLKYLGGGAAQQSVAKARLRVNTYQTRIRHSNSYQAAGGTPHSPASPMGPPPPYSPHTSSEYPDHMNPFETPPHGNHIGFRYAGSPPWPPNGQQIPEEEELAGAVGGVAIH